jgi:hypothetical protein
MRAQNDRSKAADIFVSTAFALVLCLYHSGARGRNSTKKNTLCSGFCELGADGALEIMLCFLPYPSPPQLYEKL